METEQVEVFFAFISEGIPCVVASKIIKKLDIHGCTTKTALATIIDKQTLTWLRETFEKYNIATKYVEQVDEASSKMSAGGYKSGKSGFYNPGKSGPGKRID